MRKEFDPFYSQRCKNWGGGYPRPLIEPVETAWLSTDH